MKNGLYMVILFSFSVFAQAGSELQLRELSANDVEAAKQGTTSIAVKSSKLPIDRYQKVHPVFATLSGSYVLSEGQNKFCEEFKLDELTNKDLVRKRLKELKGYIQGKNLYAISNIANLDDTPKALVSENAINLNIVKHNIFSEENISCMFVRQNIGLEFSIDYNDFMGSDGSSTIALSTHESQISNDLAATETVVNIPMTIFSYPPHPPRAVCKTENAGREKCSISLEISSKQVFDFTF